MKNMNKKTSAIINTYMRAPVYINKYTANYYFQCTNLNIFC